MEIERKFLVLSIPDLSGYKVLSLEQGYLCTKPVVRARKECDTYYLTYKGKGTLAHEEYNLPLTKEAYKHLIVKADGNIITKKRYLIPYLNYTIELDIFEGDLAPLVYAEVEFETIEDAVSFLPPEWFGEDVTEDYRFTNAFLSTDEGRNFIISRLSDNR